MYYFGGGSSCGCQQNPYFFPSWNWNSSCCNQGNNSNYAIILVLFILLVIVIGARFTR